MNKWNTKTIVLMGLLAAINIVLARFLSFQPVEQVRISLDKLPIILTAILFGPLEAAMVGLVADFLGCTLFSLISWYAPMALTPVIIGLWSGVFRKKLLEKKVWKIFLIIFTGNILGQMLYNTYWLSILYGNPFWALFPVKVLQYTVISVVETSVLYWLLKRGVEKIAD